MIDIDFKFQPVGQGAFYTGVFTHRLNNRVFSFVYDCGTHSSRQYINKQIDLFVTAIRNQKLDILFISHFHDDHINKIGELLDKTGGAKYAILPYLTPEELFMAYVDAEISGADPETLSFIQNQTQYLFERKVEHIIFIHPSDDKSSSFNDEPDIKDPDPQRVLSEDFEFQISKQLVPVSHFDKQDQVSHYYDLGKFTIVNFWEFKFFNKTRNSSIIDAFVIDLKKLLTVTSFDFNDLANFIANNKSTFQKKFNAIYSKNFGARQLINDTSLVIYHGPIIEIANRKVFKKWLLLKAGGTLLTGDIKFDQNCLTQIKSKWIGKKYIDKVDIFQIPHHGAENYIESSVISTYTNVYWWVINFGLGNKYKHPRQSIVDLIDSNKSKGKIFANTQINGFCYGCLLI